MVLSSIMVLEPHQSYWPSPAHLHQFRSCQLKSRIWSWAASSLPWAQTCLAFSSSKQVIFPLPSQYSFTMGTNIIPVFPTNIPTIHNIPVRVLVKFLFFFFPPLFALLLNYSFLFLKDVVVSDTCKHALHVYSSNTVPDYSP